MITDSEEKVVQVMDRDLGLLRLRVWERVERQERRDRVVTWVLWAGCAVLLAVALWERASW